MAKVVVVGSSNTDLVVKTKRIPKPGETVIGGDFIVVSGGKGANQAVAAAKLGADVTLVARVGTDDFGEKSLDNFRDVGIDTSYIIKDSADPSGVALIFVEDSGENCIVVAPGANSKLTPEDVEQASEAIKQADVLVCQLEIPLDAVERALDLARKYGVRTILNPAPAIDLPEGIYAKVDVFTPNETEAAAYAGLDVEEDAVKAGRTLLAKGVGAVVMTLGSEGALLVTSEGSVKIPSVKVTPVDTTAAGDAFNGGLATAIAEGQDLESAARFASRVAAISVTRMGAQPSMPSRDEVEQFQANT